MKKLQKVEEAYHGLVRNDGAVCVNVELIWLITKNEIRFIKEFASTLAHELLHIEIANAVSNTGTEVGEEKFTYRCL